METKANVTEKQIKKYEQYTREGLIEKLESSLSTLKQVIEGMKKKSRIAINKQFDRLYNKALSDVLTAITKMEGK